MSHKEITAKILANGSAWKQPTRFELTPQCSAVWTCSLHGESVDIVPPF